MINFQDFTSLVEVLTIANFSYSSFQSIQNPLNETFKKIPPGVEWLRASLRPIASKSLKNFQRDVSVSVNEVTVVNKSNENGKSFLLINRLYKHERTNSLKIVRCFNKFNRISNKIEDKEKERHLFTKNLPPLYLMAAFFGVFILILATLQSHYISIINGKQVIPQPIIDSVFLLMELIAFFYVYIMISTFAINKIKAPRSIYTLSTFILFTFIIILTYHNSLVFRFVFELNDFAISVLIIVFCGFSFIFHLLRQLQVKLTYLLILIGIFSFAFIRISLFRVSNFLIRLRVLTLLIWDLIKDFFVPNE